MGNIWVAQLFPHLVCFLFRTRSAPAQSTLSSQGTRICLGIRFCYEWVSEPCLGDFFFYFSPPLGMRYTCSRITLDTHSRFLEAKNRGLFSSLAKNETLSTLSCRNSRHTAIEEGRAAIKRSQFSHVGRTRRTAEGPEGHILPDPTKSGILICNWEMYSPLPDCFC